MNIKGYNSFFNDMLILYEIFMSYTLLSDYLYTLFNKVKGKKRQHGKKKIMDYWWEDSTSSSIPPTSTTNIISQHNKKRMHYF